jgi:hypothetical protein
MNILDFEIDRVHGGHPAGVDLADALEPDVVHRLAAAYTSERM